ncbi:MAG: hypothetical protein NC541_01545 [bacterium]|nr:hypothetical protein [bacterium]
MKRNRLYRGILLPLLCLLLGGCSQEELLKQVPRDYAAVNQYSEDAAKKDVTAEAENGAETAPDGQQAAVSFLCETAFEYARQSLDPAQQLWYDEMKYAMGGMSESVRLSGGGLEEGYDEADIDRIFQCVLADHPELFYVEGYSYTKYTRGEQTTAIDFSGTYSVDPETALVRKAEIEASAEAILAGLEENADQYAKVKYVYDTVIRSTDYELNASDNQNIYSVFVNHLSVCQGYAKATQYLLNRLGVDCALVLGTVDTGEGHAWNLVRVDGEFYYVDTTWGDASYRMEGGGAENGAELPQINYDYLNVTTAELLKTHSPGDGIPLPVCTATEANYYFREGALFSGYDREQMELLFERAREQGREDVTVKCTDEISYGQVVEALIDRQEIFDFLDSSEGTVAYARNRNQLSLTFWVTNE